VTIALSLTIRPQFVIECLRRSNEQGVDHFGTKFGEEGVDRCKSNCKVIWVRRGAVVCRRSGVDFFCRLSTMYERDRQTDKHRERPLNGNIDTNRRNCFSAMKAYGGELIHF